MLQKLPRGAHRTACGLRALNACSRRQAAANPSRTGSPPYPTFAPHVFPSLARPKSIVIPAWSRYPRPLSTGADVVLHDFSWNIRHVTPLACFAAGWWNSTLFKFQCEQPSLHQNARPPVIAKKALNARAYFLFTLLFSVHPPRLLDHKFLVFGAYRHFGSMTDAHRPAKGGREG